MAENLDFKEIDEEYPENKENIVEKTNSTQIQKPKSAYILFVQDLKKDTAFQKE